MMEEQVTINWKDEDEENILDATNYKYVYALGTPEEIPFEQRVPVKQFIGNFIKGMMLSKVAENDQATGLDQEPGYQISPITATAIEDVS